MALRENSIDIPFISSEGFSEEVALGALYESDSAVITQITPDTGALDATGGDPTYKIGQEIRPPVATLQITPYAPRVVQTHDALTVIFDIWSLVDSPLHVIFDIASVQNQATPLKATFDIIESNNDPLVVTFDILTPLVGRRLTADIQGPVALAVIS